MGMFKKEKSDDGKTPTLIPFLDRTYALKFLKKLQTLKIDSINK